MKNAAFENRKKERKGNINDKIHTNLYITVHYKMVLDTTQLKMGSPKPIDYLERYPLMVIFV